MDKNELLSTETMTDDCCETPMAINAKSPARDLVATIETFNISGHSLTINGFVLSKCEYGIIIEKYTGKNTNVIIPMLIDSLPVVEINVNAFNGKHFHTLGLPVTLADFDLDTLKNCTVGTLILPELQHISGAHNEQEVYTKLAELADTVKTVSTAKNLLMQSAVYWNDIPWTEYKAESVLMDLMDLPNPVRGAFENVRVMYLSKVQSGSVARHSYFRTGTDNDQFIETTGVVANGATIPTASSPSDYSISGLLKTIKEASREVTDYSNLMNQHTIDCYRATDITAEEATKHGYDLLINENEVMIKKHFNPYESDIKVPMFTLPQAIDSRLVTDVSLQVTLTSNVNEAYDIVIPVGATNIEIKLDTERPVVLYIPFSVVDLKIEYDNKELITIASYSFKEAHHIAKRHNFKFIDLGYEPLEEYILADIYMDVRSSIHSADLENYRGWHNYKISKDLDSYTIDAMAAFITNHLKELDEVNDYGVVVENNVIPKSYARTVLISKALGYRI